MFLRKNYISQIENAFKVLPITVLIGCRQVGKTSIMKSYSNESYPEILFLNGQNPATAELFQDYKTIDDYLRIHLNESYTGILEIDEFQFIKGVSTMMKLLTDAHNNLKILCTGSSSLDILQNVEESLAGRVRIIEVLSLSFEEYLQFVDDKALQLYLSDADYNSEALMSPLQHYYEEYLRFGGFPRAALHTDYETKIEIVNDIYQTYLINDVRKYVKNEHFVGFNRLLRLLSLQIGNLVNINELSRECGLSYHICESYLVLLQKMYIIKLLDPFDNNGRKAITKMKKVYFLDIGLRNIIANNFEKMELRHDNGAIFENEILLELLRNRKAGEKIYFYRTQNGTEVDFVSIGPLRRYVAECKCRRYDAPAHTIALSNLADNLAISIDNRWLVNLNLNFQDERNRMVPGFAVGKEIRASKVN